jgi:hypothetical protein
MRFSIWASRFSNYLCATPASQRRKLSIDFMVNAGVRLASIPMVDEDHYELSRRITHAFQPPYDNSLLLLRHVDRQLVGQLQRPLAS